MSDPKVLMFKKSAGTWYRDGLRAMSDREFDDFAAIIEQEMLTRIHKSSGDDDWQLPRIIRRFVAAYVAFTGTP